MNHFVREVFIGSPEHPGLVVTTFEQPGEQRRCDNTGVAQVAAMLTMFHAELEAPPEGVLPMFGELLAGVGIVVFSVALVAVCQIARVQDRLLSLLADTDLPGAETGHEGYVTGRVRMRLSSQGELDHLEATPQEEGELLLRAVDAVVSALRDHDVGLADEVINFDDEIDRPSPSNKTCQRFGMNLAEADRIWFEQQEQHLKEDGSVADVALHNDFDQFLVYLEPLLETKIVDRHEANGVLFQAFFDKPEFRELMTDWLAKKVYTDLRRSDRNAS